MTYTHTAREHFVLNQRCRFDMARNELLDLTIHVPLIPAAACLLGLMVQVPATVVLRQAVLDECWRRCDLRLNEDLLNQAARSLRAGFLALDPSTAYVKILPRIGYALVAQVHAVEASEVAKPFQNKSFQAERW